MVSISLFFAGLSIGMSIANLAYIILLRYIQSSKERKDANDSGNNTSNS